IGRIHAPGKGLSQLALPYRHSISIWLKLTSDDVKEQIYKLAKKGLTPSQIAQCFFLLMKCIDQPHVSYFNELLFLLCQLYYASIAE
uniref:Small ribosomal subunit protein uS15 N-terminal domain-containing protein n=1 Tax=Balaenoptera musculus TaxID=9771 RepID=A0A8C0D9R3_BALMU